ncbi:NucA/NucB deoxyribonuclease domain-containing protein [Streptomyces nojiriensis]|uniref:NucA/NucB deoxyribonuclease domain-containing protein n=1 Tax=Streptomyces nojiriensis TaxID=66374 RepID=UPI0035DADA91
MQHLTKDARTPRAFAQATCRPWTNVFLALACGALALLLVAGTGDVARASGPAPVISSQNAQQEGDLRTECASRAEAKTPKGWIKNRFEMCVHRPTYLKLTDSRRRLRGELWFDLWILGFSYDGSRRVDYTSSIENIRTKAVSGENPANWKIEQSFTHKIETQGSDVNPQINQPANTLQNGTIAEWTAKPFWQLTYTSPDTGKLEVGNNQVVRGEINLGMKVTSPTALPWEDRVMAKSNIRFDYVGRAAGKYKGTVFTDARVELVMSLKNPEVDQSARHILDAQQFPERTFPSWAGKTVPGGSGQPLHRMIDPAKLKDQRDESIKQCRNVWGDYSGSGLECDEYPFASTYEGSLKGDNRYSVRLIDGADNRKGGELIQKVYEENRLIDNDAFYVKIIP